jgi:hypothetical protein
MEMSRRLASVGAQLGDALGFEVVRVKPHGVQTPRVRLHRLQSGGRRAPQPYRGEPLRPDKYFSVNVDVSVGIVHLKSALMLLIKEAISLKRVPVAFTPRFAAEHNFGRPVAESWERYVDLENVIVATNESTHRISVAGPSTVARTEALSVLQVGGRHVVTEPENETYDLIVKDNPSGLGADNAFGHDDFDFKVSLCPSSTVRGYAADVRARLGEYCALHVRRGDKLREARYPNLARDTSPEHIHATLKRIVPAGGHIYILTDERAPGYFDNLKQDYEVFRYCDFPALRALIESSEPDNYLLYEVEQLLFDGAVTRIHTFAHPAGKPRLSLTTDVGWT